MQDLRGRRCLQVPEEVLMTICTLTRSDTTQPLVQCETGSSDEMDVSTPTRDGIIRLEKVAFEPPQQTSLTLALGYRLPVCLAATDGTAGGRLESTNKGKEKVTDPVTRGSQFLNLQMSSGSVDPGLGRADMGPNIGEAEDCVILDLNPLSSSKASSSSGVSSSLSDATITTEKANSRSLSFFWKSKEPLYCPMVTRAPLTRNTDSGRRWERKHIGVKWSGKFYKFRPLLLLNFWEVSRYGDSPWDFVAIVCVNVRYYPPCSSSRTRRVYPFENSNFQNSNDIRYTCFCHRDHSGSVGSHLYVQKEKDTNSCRSSISEESIKMKKKKFTYSEVTKMTRNFQTALGEGGFGIVYHGYLNGSEEVAVKVLSQSSSQGYKHFKAEVELLLRVHHINLVSLVGYCDERGHLALIYEYMSNVDLKHHLSGKHDISVLKWSTRLRIAIDAALGSY
ncbi:hypothetical protein Bca52824_010724 [Brassica carinata]|uniref:Protein kinase domain-containing protein n=1 Tax=Brassica carinata TaxID=52824 RepID=A0A8X7WDY0_BRACI|nr:hypothetical protein Bca52824_010724 [Brassica carinata]